jgi:ABC-2 type transport system ATP-binding protein
MIELNGISKTFGYLKAVKSISFKVQTGTIMGLVGPNGAGKSTTVNMISGLMRPSEGSLSVCGYSMKNDELKAKRIMGVVPESTMLFDNLTATEQLTFSGRVYGLSDSETKKRMNELFLFFDLIDSANRMIDTFSQGMKKKLSFASAIMHTPKVIILDEPFENVDPLSRKNMKDIIVRMKDKGAAILITSHALNELESLCDEVAIMNQGRIVFQSETKNIKTNIRNEVTKETYQSLEQIFFDYTAEAVVAKTIADISWL